MLATDLRRLRSDPPRGVRAEIQPEDERFALETIDRKIGRDGPTHSAHKTTAGIAWERVLTERVSDLAARYGQISILAIRWKPPGISLDLDVIVHDHAKGLVWVLDAKNAKKTDGQLEKMIDQIYFLKKHSDMLAGASTIRGAIVHRARQLERSPEPTERPDIGAAPAAVGYLCSQHPRYRERPVLFTVPTLLDDRLGWMRDKDGVRSWSSLTGR